MEMQLSRLIRSIESEAPPTRSEVEDCYAESVDETLEKIERATKTEDSSMYGVVQNSLDGLRNELRESIQELTRSEMRTVIAKLQEGSPIDDAELRLIRLWIVGDADAYIHEENNVDDWKQELERLTGEIRRLRSGPVEVESLEELRALLTDACGVARSLEVYYADRERVQHFDESTARGLDRSARDILASILIRSYESSSI
jgi:hypothetical protein